jgi:hypothetical protein
MQHRYDGTQPEHRTLLAACGSRPLRRLSLVMASAGPVPTLADLREMGQRQAREAAAAAGRKSQLVQRQRREAEKCA